MAADPVKTKVEGVLKGLFGGQGDQVEVHRTRTSKLSATIVSGSFDDEPMERRQARIWDHLRDCLESDELEQVVFTLALAPFEVPEDDDDSPARAQG